MRGLKIPKGFEDSTLEEIKTEGANVPAGFEDSVLEEITDTSKKKSRYYIRLLKWLKSNPTYKWLRRFPVPRI